MEILKVENLTVKYKNKKTPVIQNLSFCADEGEIILLCSKTGGGKTTLLKAIKNADLYNARVSGKIYIAGEELNSSEAADFSQIGYVMQRPEAQTVTDKVWHELAFGLENMGIAMETMRRRVAEICAYFGIADIFNSRICELSGGKIQLLNLASAVAMRPKLLLLDEPISRLDPIACREILCVIEKIARELSITVIISEHCLEDILGICDRVIYLDDGNSHFFSSAGDAAEYMLKTDMYEALPCACKIYDALRSEEKCPLDVNGARALLRKYQIHLDRKIGSDDNAHGKSAAIEFKSVYFKYSKNDPDVLKNLDLTIYENEIFALLGSNSCGKSTLLGVAAGILKPYSGKIRVCSKKQNGLSENAAMLPQDALSIFAYDSVGEEFKNYMNMLSELPCDISPFFDMHPYDLSGGQLQLCAICRILVSDKNILLLDEPTKGLDALEKNKLSAFLKKLSKSGKTVVIVTHDLEFAQNTADRCAMLFNGEIISPDIPKKFFAENAFYTTAFNRIISGIADNADDIADLRRALYEKN